MKERFTLRCGVALLLIKKENNKEYILLQKRQNTGIQDNKYDLSCSGHLEANETVKEAMTREAKEELGIVIKEQDLIYNSTTHARFSDGEYLLISFVTNKYEGIPSIMEPNKCSELKWYEINTLPKEIIENRKIMIEHYQNHTNYNEYGFK